MDKIEEALELSEEILSQIENQTVSLSTTTLQCLRLARLLSDFDAIEWLGYETSGYPEDQKGFIEKKAFEIGIKHGRLIGYSEDGREKGFFQLADELEQNIKTRQNSIGILTTNGVSIAGEYTNITMSNLTNKVISQTNSINSSIMQSQRQLVILRGQYYSYASKVNIELKFSQSADEVFRDYRLNVDKNLFELAPDSIRKFIAAYQRLSSNNPESWSQALMSCRRVLQEIAEALYLKLFSEQSDGKYTTKSGKLLDVSGDHYINKLFAVIDSLKETTSDNLLGSHILYTIEWIENLHKVLHKGVHDIVKPLTYEQTRTGILHTYIILGDITLLVSDQ
jgi:hypothetical protein